MKYRLETEPIQYDSALNYFQQFSEDVRGFLLESVDIAPIYGRMSIMSVDPPLEVIGKDATFTIRALNQYGRMMLGFITETDLEFATDVNISDNEITGTVPHHPSTDDISEADRITAPNSSHVIRMLLQVFASDDNYLGLYGAFSYDFVRLFEQLPDQHYPNDVPDFHLYLPDVIYVFNHLKEVAEVRYYNFSHVSQAERLTSIARRSSSVSQDFTVGELASSTTQAEYEAAIAEAKHYMKQGDIFELVLSRKFTGNFSGSALGVYAKYRQANPSPYMFYFRFEYDNDQSTTLLGASPEMFVRVEDDVVTTRPISGTAQRSDDPLQDYSNMMALLNSPKEKSELDMLIDLARNDVSRVCLPGVAVSDYRYVEKYSKVMHTIAHVEAKLDVNAYSAFDAFIACLNAGTLTGAPKIRAMELIDQLETSRRGFYGGNVGYLTFNNQLNTGIIIRSAVIESSNRGATITTQAGASLVYDSNPTAEFEETEHKSAALKSVVQSTV